MNPGRVRLVVFTLDGGRYAAFLEAVERAVGMVEITPLPEAPPIVVGVINLHGELVAVVDPRVRFGMAPRCIALSDQLLIARTPNRRVALRVDAVAGVSEVQQDHITAPETLAPGTRYVAGVAKLADGLMLIHDMQGFLSFEEEQRLDQALADA